MGLSQQAFVEKTVHEVKNTLPLQKHSGANVMKEDHADSLLGHERTHHY